MIRSFLAVILFTVLAVGNIFSQSQEALQYLNEKNLSLSSAQSQVLAQAKEEKALASYNLVRFNNITSLKEQTSFSISLPGKASLIAKRKRFEAKKTNEWTMSGTLDGDNGSIFLSATDGDVTGVIKTGKELYWLQPIGDGLHILIKVNPKKIPQDEPKDWNPLPPDTSKNQIKSEAESNANKESLAKTTTTTPVIDILVAYTSAVEQHSGNITSLVNACIQSTNDGFANSNMSSNEQVALVHAVQVSYTESGNVETDLNRLLATNDGYMDNIFALRNQYQADVVVLLVDFDNYGAAGIAAQIEATSDYAYCVVVDNYAVGNYTFAHEIGHLIGARHDNDPNGSPRAYAHGYRYDPAYWRTIMAVYDPDVLRINYWSSPSITYGGVAMGTSNWNDARRVWNERATTVSLFKGLSVSINGPSYLNFKETGTYTANIIGGSGSISYTWYDSFNGSNWYQISTNSSINYTMLSFQDVYIRLDVHDNGTGENASNTKTIHYGTPPPKIIADNEGKVLPSKFALEQNYPNPFNPSTQINYALSIAAQVDIKIYDLLGREVTELVNEQKEAGFYTVNFNASNLSSGIYLYRIVAQNGEKILFTESRRMVLMK